MTAAISNSGRMADIGKIKAAVRLKSLGASNKEIGEDLRGSERTAGRLLLLGLNPFWMKEVTNHNIGVTACTRLLAAATEADRVPDLVSAYKIWLTDAKREIEAEMQRRKANDKPALSLAEQQPQKSLKSTRVSAWLEALKSGDELGEPDFKYHAGLEEGTVEVDALSVKVDKLSTDHAIKLAGRFGDLSQELEQIAREKKAAEQARRQAAEAAGQRPSERLLEEFGLDASEDAEGTGAESQAEAETAGVDSQESS